MSIPYNPPIFEFSVSCLGFIDKAGTAGTRREYFRIDWPNGFCDYFVRDPQTAQVFQVYEARTSQGRLCPCDGPLRAMYGDKARLVELTRQERSSSMARAVGVGEFLGALRMALLQARVEVASEPVVYTVSNRSIHRFGSPSSIGKSGRAAH